MEDNEKHLDLQSYYLKGRLYNAKNRHQGPFPRVLAVCSAGLMRSATTAWILGNEPYNCNTRGCGVIAEYALISLDQVLIEWADHIVFAHQEHMDIAKENFSLCGQNGAVKPTWVLNIPDAYGYRDPMLVEIINNLIKSIGLDVALAKGRTEIGA